MSKRSRSSEETFSLFPFLAVLLCTMGTLALVFVLVARNVDEDKDVDDASARQASANDSFDPDLANSSDPRGVIIDAETLANAAGATRARDVARKNDDAYDAALVKANAATIEELQDEANSLEWFLEEIQTIREKTETSFNEERERLANLEAALAQLRDDAELARKKRDALLDASQTDANDLAALEKRVAALDDELNALAAAARALREKNADGKRSYSIVPYQGKRGTFRRPIFIECNADGVFLMPEKVKFDDLDFLLARYPGNPFDSAVRAAAQRELVSNGRTNAKGETIEPYPLVVVRPSGSQYFYAVVAALASWGDVYGYEFVDEEQKIEYPNPDPVLALNAQKQAEFARARLRAQLETALARRNATPYPVFSRDAANTPATVAANAQNDARATSSLQARFGNDARVGAALAPALAPAPNHAANAPNALRNEFAQARPNATGNPTAPNRLGNALAANPAANATGGAIGGNNLGVGLASLGATSTLPAYEGRFSKFLVDARGRPTAQANANLTDVENDASNAQLAQNDARNV
ncbi:MAG: hypothetical protein II655_11165, partial [Thermoguttaceae bacterium]|nr:hypothetical protein [Thermoguttaceae bacterium]